MPDGNPLPIDPLTDKPKINFVVPSDPVEGEIPVDMENEAWQKAPKTLCRDGRTDHAQAAQLRQPDRRHLGAFACTTTKCIVYLLEWDDRTKSVAEGKLPWAPTQVNIDIKEQDPKTGEEGSIASNQNKYTVYNDAIAIETPVKWKELPAPIKPRYLFGTNEQFPVDIVKWEADGSIRAFKGTGWDKDFEERDTYEENLKVLKGEWKNGRWYVMIQRPSATRRIRITTRTPSSRSASIFRPCSLPGTDITAMQDARWPSRPSITRS